jgi:hypothetical protein
MMKYVYIAIAIALLGAGVTIKFLYTANQEMKARVVLLEASNAEKTRQANRFAARPRTDDDVVDRLCKWADALDGGLHESKSERPVPEGACYRVP